MAAPTALSAGWTTSARSAGRCSRSPSFVLLGACFVAAGIGIGCAETAEHAAVAHLAPEGLRGSAFGVLAALQSAGNLAASAVAGVLWTLISPDAAFLYAAAWMALALAGLLLASRRT